MTDQQTVETTIASAIMLLLLVGSIYAIWQQVFGRGGSSGSPPSREEMDALVRRIEAGATTLSRREQYVAACLPVREKRRIGRLLDRLDAEDARRATKSQTAPIAPAAAFNTETFDLAPAAPTKPELFTAMTQDVIHLMMVGGSGAGKTTLARALARHLVRKGHRVIVGDPKVSGPTSEKWPGCEVFGGMEEFLPELRKVKAELDRRVLAAKRGFGNFPHVWVLLDEYWRIWPEHEDIKAIVEEMLRLAREYHIHLVLGSQDNQAASMGLQGKTKLMGNFTYIVEMKQEPARGVRWAQFNQYVNGANEYKFVADVPQLPSWQPKVRDYREFNEDVERLLEREIAAPQAKSLEQRVDELLADVYRLASGAPDRKGGDFDPSAESAMCRDTSGVYLRPGRFAELLEAHGLTDQRAAVLELLVKDNKLRVNKPGSYSYQMRVGATNLPWFAFPFAQVAVAA